MNIYHYSAILTCLVLLVISLVFKPLAFMCGYGAMYALVKFEKLDKARQP